MRAVTKWRKFIEWFSDGKVLIGLVVGAIISAGALVDAFGKIGEFVGLKRSAALQLAEDNFQAQILAGSYLACMETNVLDGKRDPRCCDWK
jgi:hypothetical protein